MSESAFEDQDLKPPAFQFYASDFLAGVSNFNLQQRGLYITLLCLQWDHGFVTQEEIDGICNGSAIAKPLAKHVLAKFETDQDGHLRNARLEFERQKQAELREARSKAGKHGLKRRWQSHSKAITKDSSPSPSPSPIKKEDTPATPVSSEHQAFVKGWSENFKAQYDSEYQFDRGRDGKAVQELLRMSIQRINLLEIAKKAWARGRKVKSFNCEKASTIHGFRQYFNDIQVEVKHGHTHQQNNRRLTGVSQNNAVNDYAKAAQRKLELQVAASENGQTPKAEGSGA